MPSCFCEGSITRPPFRMRSWFMAFLSDQPHRIPICAAATRHCDPHALDPVLDPDARHARELAHVIGDDSQPSAAGVRADLDVMLPARRPSALQFGAQLAV